MTKDRIADVAEVGHNCAIKQKHVLELAGVPKNTVVSDKHRATQVGVVPDLAIAPNDRRSLDHGTILHHASLPNKNAIPNESPALTAVEKLGPDIGINVGGDFRQCLPSKLASLEQRRMCGLGEVK